MSFRGCLNLGCFLQRECFSFFVFVFMCIVIQCSVIPDLEIVNQLNDSYEINNTGNGQKKLAYEIIMPPDHLEGVKMERDGHLNQNFRQEVLIGTVKGTAKSEDLLSTVFARADKNHDKLLSQEELESWIAEKVKEHFYKAVRENFIIFSTLDKNHNGRVSWDEYHVNFMEEQGFNKTYSKLHPENHKGLSRKVKEKILLDKAAWSEAANSDPDALNIDEFLTFRHPEHSHVSLINMVNDIMDSLDTDGDELLTPQEFSELPDSGDTNRSHSDRKKDRLREFHESIDVNKDGKVNRQELLMYNDPENPVQSKIEARKLILIADANNDGMLTLQEILAKRSTFLGSKMIDSARSFHDEF